VDRPNAFAAALRGEPVDHHKLALAGGKDERKRRRGEWRNGFSHP
jgi:hypothetical protein